jgi:hypothetical protein
MNFILSFLSAESCEYTLKGAKSNEIVNMATIVLFIEK